MLSVDATHAFEPLLESEDPPSSKVPFYRSLAAVTAVLVIGCQLAAMAVVARSQVEKAEQRNALLLAKTRYGIAKPAEAALPSANHETAPPVPTPQPAFLAFAGS